MKKFIVSLVVMFVTILTVNAETVAEIAREKASYNAFGIGFMIFIGVGVLGLVACVIVLIWNHIRDYKLTTNLHESISAYYRSQAKAVANK